MHARFGAAVILAVAVIAHGWISGRADSGAAVMSPGGAIYGVVSATASGSTWYSVPDWIGHDLRGAYACSTANCNSV